ncbi:hypothetical protein SeMB42_g04273 [Synchytrium endobioticum]|uniref:Uncharacterized protein n=1 Tax=Synchytrium endobioticum TaxID=286115 RepID=A0A507CZI9_9FUNG|nr:hypothetical protein SeLEV6574_g08561 [Synchytrium endobioticum]TPX41104.1 hypothetical protein SeLEV6574_g06255 [Synchytrium endobioticum]TPX44602.1 hypothetical protein SeMB42_g04275 [Synchytrium endobioticum]TPX44606.1 hypothetical protein SeMB42_g04271 [Synchytrium endobioticum]TPX44608.1 hypothetical protein SeMB42_g04273 [Synchytrium endobioticum]
MHQDGVKHADDNHAEEGCRDRVEQQLFNDFVADPSARGPGRTFSLVAGELGDLSVDQAPHVPKKMYSKHPKCSATRSSSCAPWILV